MNEAVKVPFWIETRRCTRTFQCVSNGLDGVENGECVTRFEEIGECWVTTGFNPPLKIRKITERQFHAVLTAFYRHAGIQI